MDRILRATQLADEAALYLDFLDFFFFFAIVVVVVIVVVVSEETGNISVAMNGKFKLRLSTKELEQILTTA